MIPIIYYYCNIHVQYVCTYHTIDGLLTLQTGQDNRLHIRGNLIISREVRIFDLA